MPEVTIRFCMPCRYQFKAIQDADAILKEFGQQLTDLRLVPGDHGVYDVDLDGKLIFSLDKTLRFPEAGELVEAIRKSLGKKARKRKA